MKRLKEEKQGHSEAYKKQKHDQSYPQQNQSHGHSYSQQSPSNTERQQDHNDQQSDKNTPNEGTSYADALDALPPPTSIPGAVPAYTPFRVAQNFPPLPPIKDSTLTKAPFTHRSTLSSYNRGTQTTPDITYERLEFLGDAYIELIASRLIFSHFGNLTAGHQSQLRELLVKNETLAQYSRAYGFENKVEAGDMNYMHESSRQKGNKGFNKVLGDVFEAYVAAVIISDPEHGFAVAEKWLTTLWQPKLLFNTSMDPVYNTLTHVSAADPRQVYNPTAKNDLQQRIVEHAVTKLEYEPYQASVELKGDQLGQNRHFIALYLTGWGYERKLLGKGEGRSKVEAGNWAAIEAMHGEAKEVVEECEAKHKAKKAERKKAQGGK
jgi:ribonuclease-3